MKKEIDNIALKASSFISHITMYATMRSIQRARPFTFQSSSPTANGRVARLTLLKNGGIS